MAEWICGWDANSMGVLSGGIPGGAMPRRLVIGNAIVACYTDPSTTGVSVFLTNSASRKEKGWSFPCVKRTIPNATQFPSFGEVTKCLDQCRNRFDFQLSQELSAEAKTLFPGSSDLESPPLYSSFLLKFYQANFEWTAYSFANYRLKIDKLPALVGDTICFALTRGNIEGLQQSPEINGILISESMLNTLKVLVGYA